MERELDFIETRIKEIWDEHGFKGNEQEMELAAKIAEDARATALNELKDYVIERVGMHTNEAWMRGR